MNSKKALAVVIPMLFVFVILTHILVDGLIEKPNATRAPTTIYVHPIDGPPATKLGRANGGSFNGVELKDNPYRHDPERTQWATGWLEGREQRNKENLQWTIEESEPKTKELKPADPGIYVPEPF